jgi:hypothetical protein
MKTQHVDSNATSLGPFLKLMLTLAEQRTQTEKQTSCGASAAAPLSVGSITAAMEEVANHQQPVRRSPIVLGPFLTMVLTLAEREAAGQLPWLRSSIIPVGPR